MKRNKRLWYQRPVWIILLLMIFFPIGIYLMWRYTNWSKTAKGIITGIFGVSFIFYLLFPSDNTPIESIEISIPDYRREYNINTEIPVNITVSPLNADINSLEYVFDNNSLAFSESGITTGEHEGTYEVYVKSGNIESNTLSISIVDIAARNADLEEETKLAEEKSTQESEKQQVSEEKTIQEVEEEKPAEKQTAQINEDSPELSSEQSETTASSSEMVWIDDTAKRYHRKNGCGMDNAYQVTLEEAISMGKTPCGRCY